MYARQTWSEKGRATEMKRTSHEEVHALVHSHLLLQGQQATDGTHLHGRCCPYAMPPKRTAQSVLEELADFCQKEGFFPREARGSPGYSIARAVRWARQASVFTTPQLEEITHLEDEYGASTQRTEVLMNGIRQHYHANGGALPTETKGTLGATLARQLRFARAARALTDAQEAELTDMATQALLVVEVPPHLAARAKAFPSASGGLHEDAQQL